MIHSRDATQHNSAGPHNTTTKPHVPRHYVTTTTRNVPSLDLPLQLRYQTSCHETTRYEPPTRPTITAPDRTQLPCNMTDLAVTLLKPDQTVLDYYITLVPYECRRLKKTHHRLDGAFSRVSTTTCWNGSRRPSSGSDRPGDT